MSFGSITDVLERRSGSDIRKTEARERQRKEKKTSIHEHRSQVDDVQDNVSILYSIVIMCVIADI